MMVDGQSKIGCRISHQTICWRAILSFDDLDDEKPDVSDDLDDQRLDSHNDHGEVRSSGHVGLRRREVQLAC